LRKLLLIAVLIPLAGAGVWYYFHQRSLTMYGPLYREYAYISNGKSNTVTVLDLLSFTPIRNLQVGSEPTGLAANPKKNEVYVVNTGSANVSVIDAESNKLVATIGVQGKPYFIDVSPDGHRAYVANSGSSNVSVLDLDHRTVAATLHVGAGPGLARVSPDGSAVVVSNRADSTVSIINTGVPVPRPAGSKSESQPIAANAGVIGTPSVRAAINVCLNPEDIAILPDSSKAFVSCSTSGQVAAIDLKADKLLALLDVGKSPVSLALKPDGGELMTFNFGADSISIIETTPNEVLGSYLIGSQPSRGVVALDNARLYVSNFGGNNVAVYDIDSGKVVATLPVGTHPDGLVLSQSQNYLLVLCSESGDVWIIQKRKPKKKFEPSEYSILNSIPVGLHPNQIVVKSFMLTKPGPGR
jgi:YVTN family beta-propeller protein